MTVHVPVAVGVPATSANLGPGFDAFGLALAPADGTELALLVRAVPADGGPLVTTRGEGAGEVPDGDDNLVWRALVAFCDQHGAATPDAALRVDNRLPLERGLGSSSAAIVAGLVLARELTGVEVGDLELVALATELEGHPDNVAPALLGGLVACATGDDGRLVVRRVNPAPSLRPVALVPETRQLTTSARAVLPETLERSAVAEQSARAGHVLAGLTGAWPVSSRTAGDLLHEPARFRAMPASGALVAEVRAAGLHAWLSGAGPTVLVDVGSDPRVDLGGLARQHGFRARPLSIDLSGAVACPEGGCAISGVGGCVRCPRARV